MGEDKTSFSFLTPSSRYYCSTHSLGRRILSFLPRAMGAWKDLEQKSDMVRFESDQDHSDCYVPGGIDWRGQVLFWVRKEQGGLDHSWGWDRGWAGGDGA